MFGVQKLHNVRCCIGTIGNVQSLALTLQSVLGQVFCPGEVAIYDCSDVGVGRDHYVQQLLQVASIMGVKASIVTLGRVPIDDMYDRMMLETYDLMWLCNDDVFYENVCLVQLQNNIGNEAAVCGTKPDITNARGYGDWSRKVRTVAKDGDPPYAFYNLSGPVKVARKHLDLGNALLRTQVIKAAKVAFKVNQSSDETTFGEDWVWGARMQKAGLQTAFVPTARSFHLDKPAGSPFKPYDTQRQLLRERLVAQGLPVDVLAEWGAS